MAMLNAAVDMLYHLGHKHHADVINDAIYKTLCEDKIHTPGEINIEYESVLPEGIPKNFANARK